MRVSTEDRDQDSSLERQRAAVLREGVAQGDLIIERESGRSADRPGWQRLLAAIGADEVSTVFADRSDRLARDLYDLRGFYATCVRAGTGWRFWSEPWLNSDAPGAEELRQRAAFDAEMESRKIGARLTRHYEHARAAGSPVARRAPLGYRIEGRGDDRHYVLDDRHLAGDLTMAGAARELVASVLRWGTTYSGLRHWKDHLRAMAPVHDQALLDRCLRLAPESAGGWLEGAAAELQGHVAKQKNERIADDCGKVTYRRLPWDQWELSRDRHEPLIDAATARRVLHQLETNHNRGLAVARGKQAVSAYPPSLTPVAFCGACGRRMRQQSTRKGRRPGDPPYRTLRCSGAGSAQQLCNQPGIAERAVIYGMMPLLVAEADRVSALMLPPLATGSAPVDPDLVKQIERTRRLAAETGLPALRQALIDLEDRAASQAAAIEQDRSIEQGRQAAAEQIRNLLPTIGPDIYTIPAARRQVLQAIERIEVTDGRVSHVVLKG
nr:recombinase family protein [Cyanobium sp. LEGE 06143]